MFIRCAACGHVLSAALTPVDEDFEPLWTDNEHVVPRGRVWAKSRLAQFGASEVLTIHAEDAQGMATDSRKAEGCCGNSSDVITHRCARCLAALGTEIDDCWTGFFFYFIPDAAIAGEPTAEQQQLWDQDFDELDIAQATVYQRDHSLFVTSWARSRTGSWFEHELVFPNANVTMPDVSSHVNRAFDQSSFDVDSRSASGLWDDLLQRVDVSTKSQFVRGTVAVHITQSRTAITVSPTRSSGPVAGFKPLPEQAIRFDSDHAAVDQQLLATTIGKGLEIAE